MKTFFRHDAAAPSRPSPPAEAPPRTGWPPLPDTPQRRQRATDARPWAEVRASDHTGADRGVRRGKRDP
jgi:hypothetical protein